MGSSPQAVEPRQSESRPAVPVLEVLFTPSTISAGVTHCILSPGQDVSIGRSPEATFTLPDGRVSRRHATLRLDRTRQHVDLRDLSVNGTFLNARPVSYTRAHDGDVIRVGDTMLLLRFRSRGPDSPLPGLPGGSPAMKDLRSQIRAVADGAENILLAGEPGTDRESVARAIHAQAQATGPFAPLDCTGLAKDAWIPLRDLWLTAQNGTLFLQSITVLSLNQQSRLAELATSNSPSPRVVTGTDPDLVDRVRRGEFRSDLYRVITERIVHVPALRERREDILGLIRATWEEDPPPLEPDLVEGLLAYDWPYNQRELVKVSKELRLRGRDESSLGLDLVRRRLRRRDPDLETEQTLPVEDAREAARRARTWPAAPTPKEAPIGPPPTREQLLEALQRTRGNISRVSRETGRSRRQIYRYLEEHGLNLDDFRR